MNPLQANAGLHASATQRFRHPKRLAIAFAICALAGCDQTHERPQMEASRAFLPAYAAPVPQAQAPLYPEPAADAVEYSAESPQPPTF
ncbi:MAG: hypothetical protein MUF79_13055 [Burkholderiales bacterium]|jgi:hypothetical protein|nr:hypothetical protein [Burkholderiales bacterium]